MTDLVDRINQSVENEARSCSMDFGRITPLYVFRDVVWDNAAQRDWGGFSFS